MDLSDSKISSIVLLVNAVLLFSMFYLAGALAAVHGNKKDLPDE